MGTVHLYNSITINKNLSSIIFLSHGAQSAYRSTEAGTTTYHNHSTYFTQCLCSSFLLLPSLAPHSNMHAAVPKVSMKRAIWETGSKSFTRYWAICCFPVYNTFFFFFDHLNEQPMLFLFCILFFFLSSCCVIFMLMHTHISTTQIPVEILSSQ